jgi:hypothetical protein
MIDINDIKKYGFNMGWDMKFKSKAEIERYVKDLLKNAPVGEPLGTADKELLIELINRHPQAHEKIGGGIAKIMVRFDPIWKKNRQFVIVRHDGSAIDFSYKICIHGDRRSPLDMFRIACRSAIIPSIIKFKLENLSEDSVCPHLGIPLNEDNAHVDHVKPLTFNRLVHEFIINNAIDINEVKIIGEIKKSFEDKKIENKFRKFHDIVACLQLVSDVANQTVCKTGGTAWEPR